MQIALSFSYFATIVGTYLLSIYSYLFYCFM